MGLVAGAETEQEGILHLDVEEISNFYSEFLPHEDLNCQLEGYALLNKVYTRGQCSLHLHSDQCMRWKGPDKKD